MSDKVTPRHLCRKAILYVRQSSVQQLLHNEESRRLQYAMRGRLQDLGWKDVEVIDDDLGRSASGVVERAGFQRLVAEVSLGEVGAVGARELSRFARNSRDWQKLIEVCRYVDTLLVDQDAVYDPRHGNDRLLLGLKGTLNEYELDLLRLRGQEARREKARRGEYLSKIAAGYRKSDDGTLEMTPDVRVQQAIRVVFDKSLEFGSARQCLLWLCEHGLQLPVNRNHRGEVRWRRPTYCRLHDLLTNPIYAGAYAYGRSATETVFEDGEPRVRVVRHRQREEWMVLLKDHHEAYIDWGQFERIQEMLTKNSPAHRAAAPGAAKGGSALLAGLLRCRRCGQKLTVSYSGVDRGFARYTCDRRQDIWRAPLCMGFSSIDVDDRVARAVLEVLRPAAIEASLRAAAAEGAADDEVITALELERKAAQYAADRAGRQFDAADPDNRLVADELERRWNGALERLREVEDQIRDDEQDRRSREDPPSAEAFALLGADLASVWNDAATDVRNKKRLVRTLIEEIVADVEEAPAEIVLVVHWKGGVHTELRVPKRSRGHNRTNLPPDIVEAVRRLALVCDDGQIAHWLNRAGIPTAKGNRWCRSLVAAFRNWRKIPARSKQQATADWVTLEKAATLVGLAQLTVKRAIRRGALRAEQPLPGGPWLIPRAELECADTRERLLKKARQSDAQRVAHPGSQLKLGISRT